LLASLPFPFFIVARQSRINPGRKTGHNDDRPAGEWNGADEPKACISYLMTRIVCSIL
jgi:hypothetical protein